MSVQLRRFKDAAAFLDRAEAFLGEREDLHSLHLGILDRLERNGPYDPAAVTLLMTVEEAGEVVGFAMRTPPHKLLISNLEPNVIPLLAKAILEVYEELPAVLGPRPAAYAFAEAWSALTGASYRVGMENAIHRLDRLVPPRTVPGLARPPAPGDLDILVTWYDAFEKEARTTMSITREGIAAKAASGDLALWAVDDQPVSMAGIAGRTPNSGRVGPVYTPPAHRGRGFGSAVTAAVTRQLLEEGKAFCTLYTDLANPTSNKIYRSLGYRVVAEVVDIHLEAGVPE